MIPREPKTFNKRNIAVRVNDGYGNVDKILDKLSTKARIISPNFNFFKSRYRKGQKLPAFMENLNNRMAITGLSYEMLKANNYVDTDFAETQALCFGAKKSFRVEKKADSVQNSPPYEVFNQSN